MCFQRLWSLHIKIHYLGNINETLRKINADERTIEAKKSIKKGIISMFKRHTDD